MSYAAINTICQQLEHPVSAAEAHGMATAILCTDETVPCTGWLAEILADTDSINEQQQLLLSGWFEQNRKLLMDDGFVFTLFLPDDDAPLPTRAQALKDWCQGFIYGIGLNYTKTELAGESREILKDIIEFSKLEASVESEEDEAALVEILEYLRAAILLLKETLQPVKNDDVQRSLH